MLSGFFLSLWHDIKLRRMRWVGCMPHIEESKNAYQTVFRKPKVRRPVRILAVNGRIISKCIMD
jgi:hypothetical protein